MRLNIYSLILDNNPPPAFSKSTEQLKSGDEIKNKREFSSVFLVFFKFLKLFSRNKKNILIYIK